MIVTIHGTNYEGAHFRGFASATDNLPVMINVTGTEHNIARYVLENFSYGLDPDDTTSIRELIQGYKSGETPQWDGCGGVVRIAVDGVQRFVDTGDGFFKPTDPWLDLGTVDADTIADPFNDVNERVIAKVKFD